MSRAVPSREDEQLDAVAAGTFDDPFAILGRHEAPVCSRRLSHCRKP
jgi:hypothetical protein